MCRQGKNWPNTWAPPGGHLEMQEEFIDCVKREIKEEVNLNVKNAKLWAVNNNFNKKYTNWHYVNLDFLVTDYSGTAKNMEIEKCKKSNGLI